MKKLISFLAPLLFTISGHAISQIGPKSVGSQTELFRLLLPINFPTMSGLPDNEMRVNEKIFSGNGIKTDLSYFLIPFSNVYNFEGWDEGDIRHWFEDEGWFEVINDDCRASYIKLTKNSVRGVSTWGNGKGLIVIGPKKKWVQRNILTMLQDLELLDGACSWN